MTDAKSPSHRSGLLGRRDLLRIGMAAAATGAVLLPEESEAAMRALPPRFLSLLNLHTGEHVRTEYWAKGRYQKEGLRTIAHLLRDHRTGAVHTIDPRLLDLLHTLQRRVGTRGAVHIISGYRSPESNAWLRERDGSGVAQNSFHMKGKAIDLRIPGLPLRHLHRAALSLRAGGVGYYPESDFVHVDVGPVRHWSQSV